MGGECRDFPSKFSRLTVKKTFVGEHFGVSEISGSENFCASERRELWSFFVENFLSHSTEKIR